MASQIQESDWKLLRKKLPEWQEAHMGKLLSDYSSIASVDAPASERFWELDERIREDRKSAGVSVRGLSRSNAMGVIANLLADGAISPDDLEEFSDKVKGMAQLATDRLEASEGDSLPRK